MPCDRRSAAILARAAATVALASLLQGCAQERLSKRERLSFSSDAAVGGRITIVGEGPRTVEEPRALVEPLVRMPWGGAVLPIVRPDGLRAAIEVSGPASWAVRMGDPLPPSGLRSTIEAVSLDPSDPGTPLMRLEGPWILGRASNARGFLVERPHVDGRRDLGLAGWDGGVEVLVADRWCNAHATIDGDGALAWSRRAPESGEWRLVVRRGIREIELPGEPGTDWLMPVFAGDGRGLFAVELRGSAASFAWLPFDGDGMPASDSVRAPARLRSPASATANLAWAVRALEPTAGSAASPAGSGRLLAWIPDGRCMALWQPGGELQRLAPGSLSGTAVDAGNLVLTVDGSLCRVVVGAPPPHAVLAEEPWVPRTIEGRPGEIVGMLARGDQVQFARLTLRAAAAAAR